MGSIMTVIGNSNDCNNSSSNNCDKKTIEIHSFYFTIPSHLTSGKGTLLCSLEVTDSPPLDILQDT